MTTDTPVLIAHDVMRSRKDGSGSFTVQVKNMRLNKGEVLAITGPSGTGKSTLLELIGMTLSPDTAQDFKIGNGKNEPENIHAYWQKNNLDRLTGLRASNIGYLLQSGGLLPFLNVKANINLPLVLLRRKKSEKLFNALIKRLRIEHLLNRFPNALSAGERQRVALARALIHCPALLLADEPTAALDPDNADIVFELLLELVERQGTAAIIVSHDIQRVRQHKLKEISPEKLPPELGAGSLFNGEATE